MRRLPLLLLLLVVVAVAAEVPSWGSTTSTAKRFRVTVYFLTDGQTAPLGVRRTVVRRGSGPAVARLALEQLLAGPSSRDRQRGLTTAIPPGTSIRSFSIVQLAHGSTATVGLLGLPPLSRVNGVRIAQVGTQIARTVIGLSDVARVRIESNGHPWSFWLMRGGVSRRPWDYQLLVGLWVGRFKALP